MENQEKEFMTIAEYGEKIGYDRRVIEKFISEGMPIIDSQLGRGRGKCRVPVKQATEWLIEKGSRG